MTERAQAELQRIHAWRRLFIGEDGRVTPEGELALADLRDFCRINRSPMAHDATGAVDPLKTIGFVGRTEVFFYIEQRLAMSIDRLMQQAQGGDVE